MPGVTETIGLVAAIISIAGRIEQLTANAQHSREKCSQLKEHVISIRDLLKQLEKEEWTADLATEGVLRNLKSALDEAERLVRSCELKKPLFQRMINSQEKARKFDALDERISRILDRFQLVHIILIVNMQKDRFFMKVLDKLLQHGACRSLPKSEREELKSSVRHITDREKNAARREEDAGKDREGPRRRGFSKEPNARRRRRRRQWREHRRGRGRHRERRRAAGGEGEAQEGASAAAGAALAAGGRPHAGPAGFRGDARRGDAGAAEQTQGCYTRCAQDRLVQPAAVPAVHVQVQLPTNHRDS